MAKVKYDVSDVEPRPDFDEVIPKGTYRCKIVDCTEGTSQASIERGSPEQMLTVEYEITQGDLKGRHLWDYIVLSDSQAWKMEQLVKALGKRSKGTLDTDSILGERVLIKVRHEADKREDAESGAVRHRVGTVAALPDDDAVEDDEDDEPEEEEEEGTDEDLTLEDLEAYDRKELKALIKDEELEIRVTKGMDDDEIREAIADALGLEEEEEEEEPEDDDEEEPDEDEEDEEEDDGEELTYDDVMAMNKTELKELIAEEELGLRPTAKTKVASLRAKVAEKLELEPEADDDEDDEEEDEAADYSEMSVKDLRTELKSRGLQSSGAKSALVKRLEKDDSDGGDPF